jgi:23S rRNA (adenine2503-C2)-methyltransferase
LINFYDYTLKELESWFEDNGFPRYRARQLYTHVYQRGTSSFEEMTDLSKALRTRLAEEIDLNAMVETQETESQEQDARKFLWTLADGKSIESVLMTAAYRETICFSTQVGCAFKCGFCITGKMGRLRQLEPGEIVAQIRHLYHKRPKVKKGVNLVAMGMGEPMDNINALLKAVKILGEPMGLNASAKRFTISTVGVVPGIEKIARERPDLRLAVSLNATTNETRSQLMPVNRKYPLEKLIPAIEEYAALSQHRVTLEYVMIKGFNDTPEDAKRLGAIAERFPSKVNVIPFNPSELFSFERPSVQAVNTFAKSMWRRNTVVTVRYSKGVDIQAACGQLGYDQVREKNAKAKA